MSEFFTPANTATSTPDRLYAVKLHGAPEIFSPRRTTLEDQFRNAMNERLGGEQRAAGALHAYVDSDGASDGEPRWDEAERMVLSDMAAVLPPGAKFECELYWHNLFDKDAQRPPQADWPKSAAPF